MATIHYKKTFVTGNLSGSTVDAKYSLPYDENAHKYEKEMLERFSPENLGTECVTNNKFFITDVKIVG